MSVSEGMRSKTSTVGLHMCFEWSYIGNCLLRIVEPACCFTDSTPLLDVLSRIALLSGISNRAVRCYSSPRHMHNSAHSETALLRTDLIFH